MASGKEPGGGGGAREGRVGDDLRSCCGSTGADAILKL
jgi:hypothetical protein